jgi:short-subunit dehydrogenase
MTTHFLKSLPSTKRGTIINLTSGIVHGIVPAKSAYSLGKLISLQLTPYVANENPNVVCVSLHPGIVMTDMTDEMFKPFALDTPRLAGGTAVWLATEKAKFLSGHYVDTAWDVEELYERREEITSGQLLQMGLQGTFGPEQFQRK